MKGGKKNRNSASALTDIGREQFQAVLGSNPLPALVIDVHTGEPDQYRFLAANEAAVNLYGYSEGEFQQLKLLDLHPPEEHRDVKSQAAPDQEPEMEGFETRRPYTHVKKDGSRIHVDVFAHRVRFNGRKARIAIVRNVSERVRAKRNLQESEEKYRLLVEKSLVGVYLIQDGRFVYVNARLAEIMGFTSPEEMENRSIQDLVHPGDLSTMEENFRLRLTGEVESTQYTFRARKKDGSVVKLEAHGGVVKIGEKPAVLGTAVDITDREKNEERLRLFSAAVESAPIGVQLVDLEGRIIYSNRSVERIYGFSPEEYLGTNVNDMNADSAFADRVILPSLRRKGRWAGELEVKHKDGHSFPVALTTSIVRGQEGEPIAMVGLIQDITERKKAEEALKMREAQYRGMFQAQANAVMIFDIDGKVVDANPAARRMYGYPLKEFVRLSFSHLVHPDYHHLFQEVRKNLAEGKTFRAESLDIRKSGKTMNVDVRISPFLYSGKPHALVVSRDITKIKEFAGDLKHSRDHLQALYDGSPDAILVQDEDGQILDLNRNAARMFGYARKLMSRLSLKDIFQSGYDVSSAGELLKQAQSGKDVQVQWTARRKNGAQFPVDVRVRKLGVMDKNRRRCSTYIMVIRDVTDQKKAETDLRKSEELFRTAFQTSPESLVISNLADGLFVDVNQGFCDLSGYQRHEVLGKTSTELGFWLGGESREKMVDGLTEEGYIRNLDIRIRRKDGKIRDVMLSAAVLRTGQEPQLLTATRDITDLKKAQESLERAYDELESKNRDLEAFLYTAAHDLRTPLVSVKGYAELLQRSMRDRMSDEEDYMCRRISSNVDHFDQLLSDLLIFSRAGVQNGERERVRIETLVNRVLEEERARDVSPGVKLHLAEDLPDLHLHEVRAHEVFSNLISNCLKFRHPERTLRITVGLQSGGDAEVPSGHVLLYVKDNGQGIEKDFQHKVFDLFSRPRNTEMDGTGVGLAIVKRVVDDEGGRIWLESTSGKGATFYFTLPVAD